MSEHGSNSEHSPEEIRAFLTRLSRDKRAVTAHLGFRVDLEHASFGKSDRFPQEKKTASPEERTP